MNQVDTTMDLPEDTKHIIALLQAQPEPPTKRTAEVMGGGEARLGDALLQVLNPHTPASNAQDDRLTAQIERQVARWHRFKVRWQHVEQPPPAVVAMLRDMRQWEARKAGFCSVRRREWFLTRDPIDRINLVRLERERRIAERRFKLGRKRLRQLSMPSHYIDETTSLRSAG